jgi:hypothetical protein
MKRIISLGRNRYIHLDSYGDRGSSPVSNFLITLLVIALASMTAGALVGIDITNPTQFNNATTSRTDR